MSLLVHRHRAKRKALNGSAARSKFWIRVLDRMTLVVGVIGPMTAIPQIVKIITLQSAMGVSGLSWGSTALFDIPFLLYGYVHKDRAIMTTYSLWFACNCIITALVLIYP